MELCSPKYLSNIQANGAAIGHKRIIIILTNGVSLSAISNYLGPVQRAWGKISPAKIMNITEIIIANAGGTTLSKKIGNASIQNAFPINRVHSN